MFWYGPHFGGWGWVMGLGFILFWVLVAVAIFALVVGTRRTRGHASVSESFGDPFPGLWRPGPPRGSAAGPAGGPAGATPEQILADRFARGEIDENEYRQRMSVLRDEAGPAGPAGFA